MAFGLRSVGVEEELLLIDPSTRTAASRAPAALRRAGSQAGPGITGELFRHVVEVQTEPTTDLDALARDVRRSRRRAMSTANEIELVVAASGTAPLGPADVEVSNDDRYLEMVQTFGDVARRATTCGLHVHVSVGSDEEGVGVIDRLAPWLPLVLALSSNSPFADGRDTGYASWRLQVWDGWPSAGPTEPFGSLEAYRRAGRALVSSGAARDLHMLYFDARLSELQPTVEVRVCDVPTDPEDTVVIAALVRALVCRSAQDAARGVRTPPWRTELVRAARWRASRFGLSSTLLHPVTGDLVAAPAALDALIAHVHQPLCLHQDLARVEDGVARILGGSGSSRQRAALERTGTLQGVVDDLVERSSA